MAAPALGYLYLVSCGFQHLERSCMQGRSDHKHPRGSAPPCLCNRLIVPHIMACPGHAIPAHTEMPCKSLHMLVLPSLCELHTGPACSWLHFVAMPATQTPITLGRHTSQHMHVAQVIQTVSLSQLSGCAYERYRTIDAEIGILAEF